MLNSWFGQKASTSETEDPFNRSTDAPRSTARVSASTTADHVYHPVSSDKRHAFTPISTPHDAILADLHGGRRNSALTSSSRAGEDEYQNEEYSIGDKSPYLSSPGGPSPKASTQTTPRQIYSNITPSVEVLHDPFDGSVLGLLALPDPSLIPDEPEFHLNPSGDERNAEMWANLSRVLDLQSQIARMHIEMEGIGLRKPGDTKGKGKGKNGIGMGKTPGREGPKMRPRQASTLSQFETDGEHEGDEEGVGMADEEVEKNKAREDEFAKLADQFEGRKESIADIMNRLDDLSKALTEFHSLQVPKLEFPTSRQNSVAITTSSPVESPLEHSGLESKRSPAPSQTLPSPRGVWPNTAVLPQSLSRSKPPSTRPPIPVPALIVNSVEAGMQPHVFDSPASTLGSLKLPPEE